MTKTRNQSSAQAERSLKHSDGRYYDVNFFEYFPDRLSDKALPTSWILDQLFRCLDIGQASQEFALRVRDSNGTNTALWGLRKEHGVYSVEYYFYYPKQNPANRLSNVLQLAADYLPKGLTLSTVTDEDECYLTSVNLNNEAVTDVNVYRSDISGEGEDWHFPDKGLVIKRHAPVFHSFSLTFSEGAPVPMNTYYGFFDADSLNRILTCVHDVALRKFPQENPCIAFGFLQKFYLYFREGHFKRVLVAEKKKAIGLYFLGLNVDEFIRFLKEHDYENTFIHTVENNRELLRHIVYDVGIDYQIGGGELIIKKTAFWGSF